VKEKVYKLSSDQLFVMKNFVLSLVVLLTFTLLVSSAQACISFPSLELKSDLVDNQANIMSFRENYNDETAVLAQLSDINDLCSCLTADDMDVIKDFVVHGYSVKEQTNEEYVLFLEEVKQTNDGRPDDCLSYQAVSHNSDWTGYIATGSVYDEVRGCAVPTCGGGQPIVNLLWNDLVSVTQVPEVQPQTSPETPEALTSVVQPLEQSSYLYPAVLVIALIAVVYLFLKTKKRI